MVENQYLYKTEQGLGNINEMNIFFLRVLEKAQSFIVNMQLDVGTEPTFCFVHMKFMDKGMDMGNGRGGVKNVLIYQVLA